MDKVAVKYQVSESSFRTTLLKKNISASFVFKGGSILINLLLVPLMINYLTPVNYGVWLIITSVIGWAVFFDFGLGNGLKNQFAQAVAENQLTAARTYVSTTYAWITVILICSFVCFLLIIQLVDLSQLLNINQLPNSEIEQIVLVIFAFFSLRLICSLVTTLLAAIQLTAVNDGINFLANAIVLGLIYILIKTTSSSLLYLSVVVYSVPVVLLLIASIILFSGRFSQYKPSFKNIEWKSGKSLMKLGGQFFLIQLAGIIIFSTDNVIIAQLLNPEEVTIYNIAFRFFGLITMGFSIVCAPCWSAYTEAYHKQDFEWIKKITNKLVKIWAVFLVGGSVMLLLSEYAYEFWVGTEIEIPFQLSVYMALYVSIITFGSIFVTFINGVGKIRLQLYFSIFAGLFNIPLSVFFADYLHLGSSGVILATIICLSYGPFVSYFQYQKIIKNKASGIWNK